MKKQLIIIILMILAVNFIPLFAENLSGNGIKKAAEFSIDDLDPQVKQRILDDRRFILLLKVVIIILCLLWGISYMFLRSKQRKKTEQEKRIYLDRDYSLILKQRDARIRQQEKEFADFKKQLMHSQEQYKTLIENLHEGMVIVDENENFLFVNKYALEIYACQEEDIIGHNVSEFTDEHEFNRIMEQTSLRKTGVASKYELVIYQPNGERRLVNVSASPIIENNKFKGSVGLFVDITEQKRNETIQEVIYNISNAVNTSGSMDELYKKIHKDLGVVIDTTNFYIALYDSKTNIIHTPHYVDQLNKAKPKPQMMGNGLTAYVIHSGKSLFLTEEKRNDMIQAGLLPGHDWKSKIWLGVPLKIQDETIGAIAVQSYENADQFSENDLWLLEFVSEQIALAISRKRAEKALRESEKFNRAIIENSPLAISARDHKGRLLVANKAWMKLWDKQAADLETDYRERKEFKLDERDEYLGEFRAKIQEIYRLGGELYIPELKVRKSRAGNQVIWISQYFYALLNESRQVDKVIIITENITKRKQAEDKLKASLIEKEILLKEVHHRVKNNMQVISSMLKLQSHYIEDKKSLELFKETQNRVKSMALIHEKLYQSENFEKLDFDQYVKVLTNNLFRTFSNQGCVLRTYIESNNVKLDMNKAIPCGLIINELVSNSLKHAFKNRDIGKIELNMSKDKGNYLLKYSDDGVGFPEELDFKNTESLGMQLVNALSQQLHGTITLENSNGTQFQLSFPENITD